ncbi:MAG: Gfo/Idh/MocA family oxidoreductase [Armatimonadetes bacterium]|nr:Gfo/Idh/MocA family oxidoreductase [Armatimonadota bacterium]MDW8122977.1 Gfo/Idh/MocA family oxidoreductase [Armatimonadota bacterium]
MRGKEVRVGLIGAGFAARFHYDAFRSLPEVKVVAVASRTKEKAEAFARERGIPDAYGDYQRILDRTDIDLIDVVTPNFAHKEPVIAAAQSGKNVIVEKPLTGYFGEDWTEGEFDRRQVSARKMYERAVANAREMVEACRSAKVVLGYAENFCYAPTVQKALRLLEAAEAIVLYMRGEEAHSGSHSPYSMRWKTCGGGALLRLGSHPLGAMLYVKKKEGVRRFGRPIRPRAVTATIANLTQVHGFEKKTKHFLVTGWVDVENFGTLIIEFEDGSVGLLTAHDACLGGIYNVMEFFADTCRIQCHINPNNPCVAYAPEPTVFEREYIAEKLETKAGWSFPSVNEDFMNGYPQEMADFVRCVQEPGREPESDGVLGLDVVRVTYAAYLSAEEGRKVALDQESEHNGDG